jgi:hypothetical protein
MWRARIAKLKKALTTIRDPRRGARIFRPSHAPSLPARSMQRKIMS